MSTPAKKARKNVAIHTPSSRLTTLVNRSGGMWREQAIEEATRRVEELRGPAMDSLDRTIAQLEVVATDVGGERTDRLHDARRLADRIIALAETFGLSALAEATKRLCDLLNAFCARKFVDEASIRVHLRAIRLFGPKSAQLSDEVLVTVLAELRKVLDHFQIEIPPEMENQLAEE